MSGGIHTDTLMHFRPEERPLVKRLRDLANRADELGYVVQTEFLTPRAARAAQIVAGAANVVCSTFGGYQTAERVRACFSPGSFELEQADFGVVCIRSQLATQDDRPRHGDVLGSLVGLSLERDRIGDIVIDSDAVYVFCSEAMVPFLLTQWLQAGRIRMRPELVALTEVPNLPAPLLDENVVTLQSLRLDAFVAHAFGMSRAKAVSPIAAGKVALNFAVCTDPAAEIDADDIISVRGFGRARVLSIEGESRSGRTFVRIGRYRG